MNYCNKGGIMKKNKHIKLIVYFLWIVLFIAFGDITEYLIQSGLASVHRYWVLAIELGWLALGWFCFWLDYKYRLSQKKNRK